MYHGADAGAEDAYERRTESVNALCVNLQRLLHGRAEKLVLVLEGIDKQRGRNLNTLPALSRLSEIVHAKVTRQKRNANVLSLDT